MTSAMPSWTALSAAKIRISAACDSCRIPKRCTRRELAKLTPAMTIATAENQSVNVGPSPKNPVNTCSAELMKAKRTPKISAEASV